MSDQAEASRRKETIVRAIVEGDRDVTEAAAALGVDVTELANLADDRVLRTVELMRHLSQMRNEQFLDRFRIHAIVRLVQLVDQREDPELARKACVDLLRADLTKQSRRRLSVTVEESEPVDTDAVLAMLREIGCR